MKSDLEILAESLQSLRKQKGLTQKQLAVQADVPLYAIQACEKAKDYRGLLNMIKLANFFGVSTDRLFFGENRKVKT